MPENSIHIYTDGACSGNPGNGGFAFTMHLYGKDTEKSFTQEYGGFVPSTTNNKMEMLAAIAALSMLETHKDKISKYFPDFTSYPITLFTDSKYQIQGITSWIHNWKKNNWKLKNKDDVKNKAYWILLDRLNTKFKPKWQKVAAHSGHIQNDRVDAIAVCYSKNTECNLQQDFGFLPLSFESLLSRDISFTREATEQGKLFTANKSNQSHLKKKTGNTNNNPYPAYISLIANKLYKDYSWDDCKKRVLGVSATKYKKVKNITEEHQILKKWGLKV